MGKKEKMDTSPPWIESLCDGCYEINKGYTVVHSGKKICVECGGMVLDLQEAADRIAELKAELEYIRGHND